MDAGPLEGIVILKRAAPERAGAGAAGNDVPPPPPPHAANAKIPAATNARFLIVAGFAGRQASASPDWWAKRLTQAFWHLPLRIYLTSGGAVLPR